MLLKTISNCCQDEAKNKKEKEKTTLIQLHREFQKGDGGCTDAIYSSLYVQASVPLVIGYSEEYSLMP